MSQRKAVRADHYQKGYRLADHNVARRTCLMCGKLFLSHGPGERRSKCWQKVNETKQGRYECESHRSFRENR